MKRFITGCIALTIFAGVFAQKSDELIKSPFQVTFVPPLSSNGINTIKYENQVSLNILGGISGGLDGAELGGFLNVETNYVKGVQISGFGNVVKGNIDAVQIAGFFNTSKGNFDGVQLGGFINVVDGYFDGIQVSGFTNITNNFKGAQISGFLNINNICTDGFQLAGFANITNGDCQNTQISGFINTSKNINSAQVGGFVNIAEEVEGVQIAGFINVAKKVEGVQVAGFINIVDSIDGVPIAPLSIVAKNGYRQFTVWGNETFPVNTSFKIGVRDFYTFYTIGFRPFTNNFEWGLGVGAGTIFDIDNDKAILLEGHLYHIDNDFYRFRETNLLHQLKVSFNYQIAEHLSIYAGPSFNLLVSDNKESADMIKPAWAFHFWSRYNEVSGWFGLNLGMGF